MQTTLDEFYQLLADEGYTRESDPILFEYIDRWLFNNQLRQWGAHEMADAFLTTSGFHQYQATGTVPEEDD